MESLIIEDRERKGRGREIDDSHRERERESMDRTHREKRRGRVRGEREATELERRGYIDLKPNEERLSQPHKHPKRSDALERRSQEARRGWLRLRVRGVKKRRTKKGFFFLFFIHRF